MSSIKSSKILLAFSFISIITACQVKLGTNVPTSTPVATAQPASTADPAKPVTQTVDTLGQVEFRRILSGDKSDVRNYNIRVSESESDFQSLWDDHTGSKTNPLFLPKIDFELKNVIAFFLGDRPTTGFSVNIDKIEETKDNITVYLKEVKPAEGSQVKAEITQPFLMIEMKKSNKKLVFENSSVSKAQLETIDFNNLETGYDSGIKEFSRRLAKTEKEFSDLYKEHLSSQKTINATVFPTIDFKKEMVAGIFIGERPSTGYTIDVNSVVKTESQIIINATEIPPPSSTNVTSIVTTPYQFIKIPKSDLPVKFDINLIVPKSSEIPTTDSSNIAKSKDVVFKALLNGDNSSIASSLYQATKSKEDFKELWNLHTNSKDSIPPEVDFTLNNVISVFMGKRDTSGFNIKINSIIETNDAMRVFVDLSKDSNLVRNFSTSPFEMVLIPKTSKPVSFIINNLATL